jgi:hypothetical protein
MSHRFRVFSLREEVQQALVFLLFQSQWGSPFGLLQPVWSTMGVLSQQSQQKTHLRGTRKCPGKSYIPAFKPPAA